MPLNKDWKISSFSKVYDDDYDNDFTDYDENDDGNIEVARNQDLIFLHMSDGVVAPPLRIKEEEWKNFIKGVKKGEFDI